MSLKKPKKNKSKSLSYVKKEAEDLFDAFCSSGSQEKKNGIGSPPLVSDIESSEGRKKKNPLKNFGKKIRQSFRGKSKNKENFVSGNPNSTEKLQNGAARFRNCVEEFVRYEVRDRNCMTATVRDIVTTADEEVSFVESIQPLPEDLLMLSLSRTRVEVQGPQFPPHIFPPPPPPPPGHNYFSDLEFDGDEPGTGKLGNEQEKVRFAESDGDVKAPKGSGGFHIGMPKFGLKGKGPKGDVEVELPEGDIDLKAGLPDADIDVKAPKGKGGFNFGFPKFGMKGKGPKGGVEEKVRFAESDGDDEMDGAGFEEISEEEKQKRLDEVVKRLDEIAKEVQGSHKDTMQKSSSFVGLAQTLTKDMSYSDFKTHLNNEITRSNDKLLNQIAFAFSVVRSAINHVGRGTPMATTMQSNLIQYITDEFGNEVADRGGIGALVAEN